MCLNADGKRPTLCQVKGVVYQGICLLCDKEHKLNPSSPHKGLYVGETARTLGERASEHRAAARRHELDSFIFKHWALTHPELNSAPEILFKVVRKNDDALSRLCHEAVRIMNLATMNSKSEIKGYKIARLSVSKSDWQIKKDLEMSETTTKQQTTEMLKLKSRVISYNRQTNTQTNILCCRKRKMLGGGPFQETPEAPGKVSQAKRTKFVTSTPTLQPEPTLDSVLRRE